MSQIEQIIKQIQSEFQLDKEGRAFVSIRGAARLADVEQSSLSRAFQSDAQKPSQLAQFLVEQGIGIDAQTLWLTNGIPDLALALILEYYAYETQPRYRTQQAKLCCRAFNSIGIRAWIRKSLAWEQSTESLPMLPEQKPTVRDELDIINLCLTTAGLDPKLTAGVMLNHAGVRVPQLKRAIAEGHQLLAASLESDLLLTPTKIGKELGVSARRVNQVLLDLGYQAKNLSKSSKTEPDYLVTDIGKPYAGNTLATGKLQNGKSDNTTYQHLKWKQEVIEIVQEHLVD